MTRSGRGAAIGLEARSGRSPGGIGPRELGAGADNEALGGNMFAVARFEADFPLGLPEEYGITGGLFLDVGSVWSLDNVNGGLTGADIVDDSMNLRSAVGFSVFWETPVGSTPNASSACANFCPARETNGPFIVPRRVKAACP